MLRIISDLLCWVSPREPFKKWSWVTRVTVLSIDCLALFISEILDSFCSCSESSFSRNTNCDGASCTTSWVSDKPSFLIVVVAADLLANGLLSDARPISFFFMVPGVSFLWNGGWGRSASASSSLPDSKLSSSDFAFSRNTNCDGASCTTSCELSNPCFLIVVFAAVALAKGWLSDLRPTSPFFISSGAGVSNTEFSADACSFWLIWSFLSYQ